MENWPLNNWNTQIVKACHSFKLYSCIEIYWYLKFWSNKCKLWHLLPFYYFAGKSMHWRFMVNSYNWISFPLCKLLLCMQFSDNSNVHVHYYISTILGLIDMTCEFFYLGCCKRYQHSQQNMSTSCSLHKHHGHMEDHTQLEIKVPHNALLTYVQHYKHYCSLVVFKWDMSLVKLGLADNFTQQDHIYIL